MTQDIEKRRIAFSERNPGVHISAPKEEPTGMYGATWTGGDGTKKKTLHLKEEDLIEELEAVEQAGLFG